MAEMWSKLNHHETEAQFVEIHFEVLSKLFAIKAVASISKEAPRSVLVLLKDQDL